MHNEMLHVPGDWDALRWAFGCLLAAHVERLRTLHLIDFAAVRLLGALLITYKAFDTLLPTALTAAYKTNALGMADALGGMTPGDSYQRLVPLMEAIPLWLHGLLLAVGGLYVATIVGLALGRRAAYALLVAGIVLELAAQLLSRSVLAPVGIVVNPNPSLLAGVLLPVVLPLALAFAAWTGRARDAR